MSRLTKAKRAAWRLAVGITGGLIVLIGIILIPYPGPGWLVVFTGLGILATEFEKPKQLLHFARTKYDAWVRWLKRQPLHTRLGVLAFTGLVIVLTVFLLNGFGILARLVGINDPLLTSPLFK